MWYGTRRPDPPAHLSVCWWGDMTFAPHFWALSGLETIEARVVFGTNPEDGNDRKTLAATLHRRVIELFTPVVTEDLHDSAR